MMQSTLTLFILLFSVSMEAGAIPSTPNHTNTFSIKQTISFGYSGAITDNESQLQYLNARYLNVTLGRFISRDSFPLMNRYIYADGNPIMKTDPSGHTAFTDAVKVLFGNENALTVEQVVQIDKDLALSPESYTVENITASLKKYNVVMRQDLNAFNKAMGWLDVSETALTEHLTLLKAEVQTAQTAYLNVMRDEQQWPQAWQTLESKREAKFFAEHQLERIRGSRAFWSAKLERQYAQRMSAEIAAQDEAALDLAAAQKSAGNGSVAMSDWPKWQPKNG